MTDGPVVFAGSMNAMPFMYASALHQHGQQVVYTVDALRQDTLCRPEYHYGEVRFPYPDWIVESRLPSQVLVAQFPRMYARLLRAQAKRVYGAEPSCYVLNGFHIAMAPFLNGRKVALSHGSDLEVWADRRQSDSLARNFRQHSIFRPLPAAVAEPMIRQVVERQYRGFENCETVVYFPRGFNARGDQVLDDLIDAGVRYVPRYDMSFEPVAGFQRGVTSQSTRLRILSAVRFKYQTFPDGFTGDNKGNDVIIRGLARFCAKHPDTEIHFVNKGVDVVAAKRLCHDLGLDSAITWHDEMPLLDLLELYEQADVCFDQVGPHWIGAVGGYALFLGKPLIANPAAATRIGYWPQDNPVCAATTEEDIDTWLELLRDPVRRDAIGKASMTFAEAALSPNQVLREVFGLVV